MLSGKIAFVTGAAQGIGKAVALSYAENGADVIIADIQEEKARKTAEEIRNMGRKAEAMKINVAEKKEVEAVVKKSVEIFGRIDILANCAGIVESYKLNEIPEEVWDRVMDINLKGVFLVSQAVANVMIKQKYGRIVNISSMVSKIGEAGNGAYCISKAGVSMLTQIMGLELAEQGITVNAVCPGFVNTEIMQKVFTTRGPLLGKTPEEYEQEIVSSVPMNRMAEPSEIADLMTFLASDKAAYITGVAITIAGGKTLI